MNAMRVFVVVKIGNFYLEYIIVRHEGFLS